jgi:hypothetical protein
MRRMRLTTPPGTWWAFCVRQRRCLRGWIRGDSPLPREFAFALTPDCPVSPLFPVAGYCETTCIVTCRCGAAIRSSQQRGSKVSKGNLCLWGQPHHTLGGPRSGTRWVGWAEFARMGDRSTFDNENCVCLALQAGFAAEHPSGSFGGRSRDGRSGSALIQCGSRRALDATSQRWGWRAQRGSFGH